MWSLLLSTSDVIIAIVKFVGISVTNTLKAFREFSQAFMLVTEIRFIYIIDIAFSNNSLYLSPENFSENKFHINAKLKSR